MASVNLKPSGWEVEFLQGFRSCWVTQWSSSGIAVVWFGSEEVPAAGSGRSTPTWECLVLTCSSCKALGDMNTWLWSASRAGLSLVCSPAQVGTWPDAELLRENCRWKQGCIKGWGWGTSPVPMKAATGQVVQSGWAALTVHPCQKGEVSLYHPLLVELCWTSSPHWCSTGELSEQVSRGTSSCQVFAEGHNEAEKWILLCQAVLFTMRSSLQFLKDLEGIISDSQRDVLQLGGVGLCFVTTLPLPSKVDVLVAFLDFLSSHANSGKCVER